MVILLGNRWNVWLPGKKEATSVMPKKEGELSQQRSLQLALRDTFGANEEYNTSNWQMKSINEIY